MSNRPIEQLIDLHEAFLACEPADRPLLGFWLGGYFPVEQFLTGTKGWRDGQILSPGDLRLAAFAADYERLYCIHRDVDDDFFYVGSAYWGMPWLEAILGCPVLAGKTSCWAEACLEDLAAVDGIRFNLNENPWMACLEQFTRELVELAAGRFPVCPPLLRGAADAANAMHNPIRLVMEYVDRPRLVRRLLRLCADVRLEVVRRLQEIIPPWHGTHAAGGYPSKVWSRRTVAYNQDDAAALLSPDLFREFLLPLEREMTQMAQVNFIHLHSSCLYPLELLRKDESYQVLEINIDHAGVAPPLVQLLPTLRWIQHARKPLLLWGHFSADDYALLLDNLSPAGLSLQPIIEKPEDLATFL